jgi:uncharacterized protein (TIGR03067 family)
MRRLAIIVLLISGPATAAPIPKTPAKDAPVNPLVGEWAGEATVLGGQRPKVTPVNLEFKADGTLILTIKGKPETSQYTIDPEKDPAELDWHVPREDAAPSQYIYKIEKDTLTLCTDPLTKKRPTEFKAAPDGITYLWSLKRVPKKD